MTMEMTQEVMNGLFLSNYSYGLSASSFPQADFGAYTQNFANLDSILYNAPFYPVHLSVIV